MAIALIMMLKQPYFTESSSKRASQSTTLYETTGELYRASITGISHSDYKDFNDNNLELQGKPHLLPKLFSLASLLTAWDPNSVNPDKWIDSAAHPNKGVNQAVVRLNYTDAKHLALAFAYRDAELPFLLFNVPSLQHAAATYFTTANLKRELGTKRKIRVERSSTNKFMYYSTHKDVETVRIKYPEWVAPQAEVSIHLEELFEKIQLAETEGNADMSVDISPNATTVTKKQKPCYYLSISHTPQVRGGYCHAHSAV